MSAGSFWSYFYEIYEAIPRQGPGDRDATLRAVRLLPALSSGHRVLDIGCGTGAQTLDLARSTDRPTGSISAASWAWVIGFLVPVLG